MIRLSAFAVVIGATAANNQEQPEKSAEFHNPNLFFSRNYLCPAMMNLGFRVSVCAGIR